MTGSTLTSDWRLWLALAALVVSMGWLDVVRGRELAVIHTRQLMVLERLDEIRHRLEFLERAHQKP